MCVVVVFLAVSVYTNTWHLCPHVTIIAGVLALPETNGPQDNKTTLFHLHFSSCSLFTAFPLFCFLFLIWHFILCLPPTWTSWPAFLSLSVNACYLHLIIPSVFLPSLWHFPPLNVNTLLKPQMCTGFIMLIFPILSMLIPLVSILGNQGKTVLLFSPACTSCCYLSWNTATSDVIILCVMFKCRVCFVSIFHSFLTFWQYTWLLLNFRCLLRNCSPSGQTYLFETECYHESLALWAVNRRTAQRKSKQWWAEALCWT